MTITITRILGAYTIVAVAALVIGSILKISTSGLTVQPPMAVGALILSLPVLAFAILSLARQRGM